MRWLAVGALGATILGTSIPARAHLELDSPPARYDGTEQKSGPCGRAGGTRGTNVTVFRPGERIEVVWRETVNHPAHYRISFDLDGDDDFVDPTCETHCMDRTDPEQPTFALYSSPTVLLDDIDDGDRAIGRAQVTLPDVECENCTLQVIQVMYDKRPITSPGNDFYYACADIALRRGPANDAGPTNDAGATARDGGTRDGGGVSASDAGAASDTGTSPDASADSSGSVGGTCAASAHPPLVFSMALAVFFLRRRNPRG